MIVLVSGKTLLICIGLMDLGETLGTSFIVTIAQPHHTCLLVQDSITNHTVSSISNIQRKIGK